MYFAEWGIYGRNFMVKNLDTSGQASKLTFVNYAFANIFQQADGTFKCNAQVTKTESGNGDGGDQWAAYGKGFDASDSVDGVADSWNDALKGNFNQLKKLKAKYPKIKVLLSIGGWSWSKWFSAAAATDALRKTLVSSCLDQYIKGNLPFDSGSNAGGAGSGLGVFDGIDIDWEYPGVQGIGYNTVDAVKDKANQVLLFQELRSQLDAIGQAMNKHFYLTLAVGAGLKNQQATNPSQYSAFVDWINVMSYDYHGAWDATGPTDFQSNLYLDPASPNAAAFPDFNTQSSVLSLLSMGVASQKINIGVPFYGRGWTGVPAGPNGNFPGLYQSAKGPATGTYEAGIEDYKKLKLMPGTVYTSTVTGQTYKYDGTNFWSYDTPADIQRKVAFALAHNLGGIFGWEADGDLGSELVNAMAAIQN